MKIYAMSDIHGCNEEFDYALSLVLPHLDESDTMLILLGDYIHGYDSYGVLKRIIALQNEFGTDKVLALKGNHEEMFCNGEHPISPETDIPIPENEEDFFISWMENLPRYFVKNKTIFVHAGIDETAEAMWEYETDEFVFSWKYPAETGHFYEDYKIIAGHVSTAQISGNSRFHDIYYDGQSHYYIDGTVLDSGMIPVLMADTNENKYYRVSEGGNWLISPYDEDD